MKLVVSACLTGRACRYDGEAKPSAKVDAALAQWKADGGEVVPVCPEELGDLGTPRPPCELRGGDGADFWNGQARICGSEDQVDRSAAFAEGAEKALKLAEGCKRAILKARSPSCGCARTWIDGEVRCGDGVFAARLRAQGVHLDTEESL
jgi:uncharacterized protein YbbK (DUF523 family)